MQIGELRIDFHGPEKNSEKNPEAKQGLPGRGRSAVALATLVCASILLPCGADAQPAPTPVALDIPPADIGLTLLEQRQLAQIRSLEHVAVAKDFGFSDGLNASGITFRHQGTEDGGRYYKMVHYDHGNGIAAADIDGDELYDLYFSNQIGGNALFRNLGGGRFEDVTEKAGVALADRVSVAASFADIDNDGDADLFVTTVKMGNVLFLNDGKGRFRDVTAEAGLELVAHSSGAVFLDYDRDGRLDLFLTNVGEYTGDERGPGGYYVGHEDAFHGHLREGRDERSVLYRNLGGARFEDVSEAAGLVDTSWSGDATFTDLNGDGAPDLYVFNMQGDDHYYESRDGRFVDRTQEVFPLTPWGTMGGKFFDVNQDGRLDLMLTDMHSDMSREVDPIAEKLKSTMAWNEAYLVNGKNNIFGNALYLQQADGAMDELSDLLGVENYWPWGMSVGDLNADSFEDVFVTASMSYPWRYGVNSVLLNVAGRRFVDAEFALGVEPRPSGVDKLHWFDLDCTGADKEHQHCAGESGTVQIFGNRGSRSSVLLDLDRDGDLDIVTAEFHDVPQVLLSDLSSRGRVGFLEVVLEGRRSNRDGLGARVEVHVGDQVQVRYHDGKSGYLSQSSLPLYFGLGQAAAVDEVVITWPSGTRQVVEGPIPAGSRRRIVESAAAGSG